jgi:hypothetical protein
MPRISTEYDDYHPERICELLHRSYLEARRITLHLSGSPTRLHKEAGLWRVRSKRGLGAVAD